MQVDKSAVKALIQALNDKETNVRKSAARALGDIMDVMAVAPLVQALKDENEGVRRYAVAALVKIGKPSVEALVQASKDKDSEVRKSVVCALLEIGEIDELVKLGKPLVETLVPFLKGRRTEIQVMAVKALGKIGDARAVDPLVQALEYVMPEVRKNAAKALGEIGDARAVKPLIHALEEHRGNSSYRGSEGVRESAAWALGKIGDARAVKPLISALSDDASQEGAIESLAKIGKPAIEPLIQAFKDELRYVHGRAMTALVKIGKPAVEPLIQVLKNSIITDVPEDVPECAARALREIGDLRAAEEVIIWISNGAITRQDYYCRGELLLGGYTSLILEAFYCDEKVSSKEAINKLCGIHTQISNNILHIVSKKRNISVHFSLSSDGCSGGGYGEVSFESERKMAEDELKRRGNPPYDPSVYLDKEAWKL